MKRSLNLIDFFCGAGGMGLGFKQAGFEIVGAYDNDKWAVKSYKNNVSLRVIQHDIRTLHAKDIPYADVWSFGFPCQDISVAGEQAGMIPGETRSGLFYEVMRLLDEAEQGDSAKLPSILVAENVKAVKRYIPEIKAEYKKRGYKMYYKLLNSKYWGVPQNRERYFMIGIREELPQVFHFPIEDKQHIPKLSSVLEDEIDDRYFVSGEKAQKIIEDASLRLNCLGDVHATITPQRVNKRQNGRRSKEDEEAMFTLTSQDQHGVIRLTNCNPSGKGMNGNVYSDKGISPTLTTNKGEGIKVVVVPNSELAEFIQHNNLYHVRRLTPRECARLQGFPETFEFHVSNSQLYKQFGNAVTVPVIRALAISIKDFLYEYKIHNK
jgi:DNA (cytosine-5)-methyltransferase 1